MTLEWKPGDLAYLDQGAKPPEPVIVEALFPDFPTEGEVIVKFERHGFKMLVFFDELSPRAVN